MTIRSRAVLLLLWPLLLLGMCFWPFTRAATKIRANQINLADVFAFAGNNTHAGTESFNATINTNSILPAIAGIYPVGSGALPYSPVVIGSAANTSTSITSAATANRTAVLPDTSGTVSFGIVEYCGATSGATQACAKTVQVTPFIVWGDVLLNGAVSQSITTLPFTDALYSCSGSDLTTPNTGIVSFTNYLAASVTIQETSGTNADHLRWQCTGH